MFRSINNWKKALTVMICVLLISIAIPMAPARAGGMQLDNNGLMALLYNTVFGQLQVSSTNPITNLVNQLGVTAQPAIDLYSSGTLTATQIDGMYVTPVNLIAAPTQHAVEIVGEVILMPQGGVTTSGAGGTISLVYTGGSVNALGSNTLAATSLTSLASGVEAQYRIGGGNVTMTPGVGISITNATQAFTGTTTMKYFIKYHQALY